MAKVTVTPKFVNPPRKPEGKYGSIRMADNSQLWFPVGMISQFTKGEPVTVEYQDARWGDNDVMVISKIIPAAPSAPGKAPAEPWAVPNFVSNVVGQAIAAGKIETHQDIKIWALAAKEAGEAVLGIGPKESEEPDYGDEPPYPP